MMDSTFHLLPPRASTNAVSVDRVMLLLTVIFTFFTLLIATLVVYFAIKYRRRAPGQHAPPESHPEKHGAGLALEITWTVIPTILVVVLFIAGAHVYVRAQQPPANADD